MSEPSLHRKKGRAAVKQRLRRLRQEPLCRICKANGKYELATEIDHIIPLTKGGRDDDANTQPLCWECHQAKTAKDFGKRYTPRLTIGPDGWPVDG